VPALSRKVLEWDAATGAMIIGTQDLVEGVENLQFLYGIDTDLDGEPEQFVNQNGVGAGNWGDVLVIRAFLLLQSATEDLDHTDNRTYQLGDVTVPAAGDNRRRMLMGTEITVRNRRLMLRGSA
jgi:type IV pilus assembly protein PilW